MHPVHPDDPFHTFFFAISSGKVIDGGNRGNDARWINHSCAPNCEAQENTPGTRVHIVALRDIAKGEELFYDYGLVMDGRITKRSEEHTSELQSLMRISYAVFCLQKKKIQSKHTTQLKHKNIKSQITI